MAAVLKMQEFSYGGTIARGSRVSVPSGVQGQSPDGGFAVSTPESETVCRHRLQCSLQKRSKYPRQFTTYY